MLREGDRTVAPPHLLLKQVTIAIEDYRSGSSTLPGIAEFTRLRVPSTKIKHESLGGVGNRELQDGDTR